MFFAFSTQIIRKRVDMGLQSMESRLILWLEKIRTVIGPDRSVVCTNQEKIT